MDYREALACLNALASHGIRPGLERVRKLLARLGNPQRDFRSVLIAGTNGKCAKTGGLIVRTLEASVEIKEPPVARTRTCLSSPVGGRLEVVKVPSIF